MAIVPLSKVVLCGVSGRKTELLRRLQEFGEIHLDPQAESSEAGDGPRGAIADAGGEARAALEYLKACPRRRRPTTDTAEFRLDEVVAEALAIKGRVADLEEQLDALDERIRALEPWGDFRLPPREEIAGFRHWFYIVPHWRMEEMERVEHPWEAVGRDNRFCYVVVVAASLPEGVPGERSKVGAVPLSEVRRRRERVESDLEDAIAARERLTRWIGLVEGALAEAEDRSALARAAGGTFDAERFFVASGWIPAERVEALREFADKAELAMTAEPPGEEDSPPTLLRNAESVAGGQSLVGIYTTPAYRAWDPSVVVLFSFAAFFAMILCDAGYALLLGGIVLAYAGRMGRTAGGRRLRATFALVVAASVAYGALAGSWFGVAPPPDSALGAIHVLDASDQAGMMRLSLGVGIVHLLLANLIVAFGKGGTAAFAPLGWCVAIVGGCAAIGAPESAPAWIARAGGWAIGLGLGAVAVFASDRPFPPRGAKEVALRALDGLLALTNVSKAFGDALSYLRLFALGLSGAYMAQTFNDLARQALRASPELGILLAAGILLVGHGINFALCLMSGVIHGLRLNFIEFFGWSLPDEGRPFTPFGKKAIE